MSQRYVAVAVGLQPPIAVPALLGGSVTTSCGICAEHGVRAVQAAKAKLGDMERQGAFDEKPGKKSGVVKKIDKKVHTIQKKRMKGKGGKTAVRKI